MLDPIGDAADTTVEYRELTAEELAREYSFSDYFRFSATVRMDRDEALALAREIEHFMATSLGRDVRVYVGVRNRR